MVLAMPRHQWAGVDPALQGGIAVLDQHDVVLLTDLPVHKVGRAGEGVAA
jgi:hypothetical protein